MYFGDGRDLCREHSVISIKYRSNSGRYKKGNCCGYEENIENKTDNPSAVEDFINPYTIVVERWEIITPIYRDYTYSSHSRIFYPKRYIDLYDLEHEDYIAME